VADLHIHTLWGERSETKPQPRRAKTSFRFSVRRATSPTRRFHSFTGNTNILSSSVFANRVFGVLARMLTESDCLGICTCLQGMHAEVDLMRLCVRSLHHKLTLSDVPKGRGVCHVIVAGQFGSDIQCSRALRAVPSLPFGFSRNRLQAAM
jgi:hypothetical protein